MLNLLCIPFPLLLTHPQALRLRLQPELLGHNSQVLDRHDLEYKMQVSLEIWTKLNLEGRGTQEGQSESLSNFSDPINIITLIINTDART